MSFASIAFTEYFIAACADQAQALAVEAGLPERDWSAMHILLPNRRTVRALQSELSRRHGLMIPPRIRPLGEPESDYFETSFQEDILRTSTPPAVIPSTRRALVLSWLLGQARQISGLVGTPETDIDIALSLGRLIDRLQEHGLDLTAVTAPPQADLAQHWQWAQHILFHLASHWGEWLQDNHLQEPIAARSANLEAFSHALTLQTPVMVAGSSGRSLAVRKLVNKVAAMPLGRVLVQGLGLTPGPRTQALATDSPSHPNYTLCRLLKRQQHHVSLSPEPHGAFFARLMQTAAMQIDDQVEQEIHADSPDSDHIHGPDHIHGLVFGDQIKEVTGVALLAHHALHHRPDSAVAVITQDENFVDHLQRQCARFGIGLDRAAGIRLQQTAIGRLACLVLEVYQQGWDVVRLLAILKHPLTHLGQERGALRADLARFEREHLQAYHPATLEGLWQGAIPGDWQPLRLMDRRDCLMTRVQWLSCWKEDMATLGHGPEISPPTKAEQSWQDWWQMVYGQCVALGVALDHQPCGVDEFCRTMLALLALERVPVPPMPPPSIAVLSAMEARLLRFDRVIVPQMIAGQYPPEPDIEPWLYRQFYQQHDIPPPEENQGLAAHDFVALLHQPEVFLTRAEKVEAQKVAASPWWERLDAVFAGIGEQNQRLVKPEWAARMAEWLQHVDYPANNPGMGRPEAPALSAAETPREFRASQISTLLDNPYAIYAEKVLQLFPREGRFEDVAAREQGLLMHRWLELFARKDTIENPREQLLATIDALEPDPGHPLLFRWEVACRMRRIADRWLAHNARYTGLPQRVEHRLDWECDGLRFTGIADRLVETDAGWVLIDYKTGAVPARKAVHQGHEWQLPILALMLDKPDSVERLVYWTLTQDRTPSTVAKGEEIAALCAKVRQAVQQVAENITRGTWVCAAHINDRPPKYDRYAQLIRFVEWGDYTADWLEAPEDDHAAE